MKTIIEKARETPIAYDVDVVVAGGGPTGVSAAIAAARGGAETLLVERYGHLGGMATGGLVIWLPKNQLIGGIPVELVDRLISLDAAHNEVDWATTIDPEMMINVIFDMLEEEGVKILLESLVVDPIVERGKVEGVILENKSGRQAVKAKVVIDTSGDGDLAARAGASYMKVGDEGLMLPMSLVFLMDNINEEEVYSFVSQDKGLKHLLGQMRGEDPFQYEEKESSLFESASEREKPYFQYSIGINKTTHKGQLASESAKVYDVDGTNAIDLTEAYIKGRKRIRRIMEFLKKNVPGFESAHVSYIAPQMGVRETRWIDGEYTLTMKDLYKDSKFDDVVVRCNIVDLDMREIPYRCLVPRGIDNLLIAGRCISYTHEVQNLAREIPLCMLLGQAAGTAASLAIKNNTTPRQLDIKLLQESLRTQGLI